MTVSGSGNLSPLGPNDWDPSMMGNSTEASHEPKDAASLKAADQGFFTSPSTQSSILSGATFDYESESQINEGKYKKTQDKTLSVKGKLRGNFSKAQASVRGFLSGFGSRASRVSARKAEVKEGGRSYLPSNTDMVNKKGNRISPELRGFYLQASGVNSRSYDVSSLSLDHLAISDFASALPSTEMQSEIHTKQAILSAFSPVHQLQALEEKTNIWLAARLGGEMISTLLDPNIETSALLRRASTVGNESLDDLMLAQSHVGTQIAKRSQVNEGVDVDPSLQANVGQQGDSTDKIEKQDETMTLLQEQLALARMMAALLAGAPASEGFVPYSLASMDSGRSFPPAQSPGVVRTFKSKHHPLGIEKQSRHTSFYASSQKQKEVGLSIETKQSLHTESLYRFSNEKEDFSSSNLNNGTLFLVPERNSDLTYTMPHDSSAIQYNASAEAGDREVLTSSFQFSAERGVSLLPDVPVSVDSYKRLLQTRKGPGAPPDPLIYQYRNVSVDPPIILRSPQPFASAGKIQVLAKPEAAAVHDDGGGGGGQQFTDDSQGESNSEDQKPNKKRKAKEID